MWNLFIYFSNNSTVTDLTLIYMRLIIKYNIGLVVRYIYQNIH